MAPIVADYSKRLRKFIPFEEAVLKADRDDRVAARMLRELAPGHLLVALDERGKERDSHQFADLVSGWMNRGVQGVVMIIGGADGLPEEIGKRADLTIALSRLTLPHRMARLLLVEQLYRAMCIIRNVPYQK